MANYFDGTKAFVKENWGLIKQGAGLFALRTWLMVSRRAIQANVLMQHAVLTHAGAGCEQFPPSNGGCHAYAVLSGTGKHKATVPVGTCEHARIFHYVFYCSLLDQSPQ